MKTKTNLLMALLLGCGMQLNAQQLAFPGAQGWGRFAQGARQGIVYHVTNLNDSGAGSLRDAVSQPNRIVVFDVAGVINLKSTLVFKNNLYVAGQTAPGEGITVYGNRTSFSGSNNSIIRYMRFRMGAGIGQVDCAGIANGTDMIFDHCSFAWGGDETFSINWDKKGAAPKNITLQNCIFGQGLMTHSAGGLIQADSISLVGNFYCDNSTRNNKIKGINQYANNIVYNWSNGAYIMGGDSEGESYVNIESNLFINGPAKGGAAFTGANERFHCYGTDNWQDRNIDGVFDPSIVTDYSASTRVNTPYNYPMLQLNPGKTLLETNLPTVGASLPYRDYTDCYMVDEVLSYGKKGALISNEGSLIYGKPSSWKVWSGDKPKDTDGDGMPDAWENANQTDPTKNDAMLKAANGYANIENYINSITKADRQFFVRAPLSLQLAAADSTSLTLSWIDYTDNEDGFIIELQRNGVFEEVGRTAANVRQFTIKDASLTPATAYTVRICAFAGDKKSEYTPEAIVKTRPCQTDLVDITSFQPDFIWKGGNGAWKIGSSNWQGDVSYADGSNVLFDVVDNTEVDIQTAVAPKNTVVKGSGHVTLLGAGYISGDGTLNKAGTGTLTIASDQDYTGATVLHEGVFEFSTLTNGGVASGLGASQEFAQNWIMAGGVYKYTGGTTTTNRSAKLYNPTELNIAKSGTNVTMSGAVEGDGDLIINGSGRINVSTPNFFKFAGNLELRGATLFLSTAEIAKVGIGTASKLVMSGGTLLTNGENDGYETYSFPMDIVEGTTSVFAPHRNCYLDNKISGSGTLELRIPYLREYIRGNWTDFNGRLIAKGVNPKTSEGSLLLFNSESTDMPNSTVTLKDNARLCAWATNGTFEVGGLSGDAGTYLMGSSKKDSRFKATWLVGNANTNETFNGIINNWDCSGADRGGTVSITKCGTGDWRLTGTNVYKGITNVNGGKLIINGYNNGVGTVIVNADATLAGKGSIAGIVNVNAGAILQAGDTLINNSRLTLKNNVNITNATVVIPVSGNATAWAQNSITVGGMLSVNNSELVINLDNFSGTLTPGTTIKIFNLSKNITGNGFTAITPEIPAANLIWDTSELATSGVIKVADATAIHTVNTVGTSSSALIYNIAGVKTNKAKGLFIQEGKKYIK